MDGSIPDPVSLLDAPSIRILGEVGLRSQETEAFCESWQHFRERMLCARGHALPSLRAGVGHAWVPRDHSK